MSRFKTKKSLGQNFLENQKVLDKIVELADLDKETDVIEIGVGSANLTTVLAQKAHRVLGFEIDTSLIPVLEKKLQDYSNVFITFGDILKLNFKKEIHSQLKITNDLTLVANIPYYITSPIIHLILESQIHFKNIILMVQKEVAERIVAKPDSSDYGVFSIYVQEFCEPKIEFFVDKKNFNPTPKVDSAVISLYLNEKQITSTQIKEEMHLVKIAFSNRRKQLKNNLENFTTDKFVKQQIPFLL